MVLRHGGSQGTQLRVLELGGIALRYAAGRCQVSQLILDHRQVLAGEIASALIGHKIVLLFIDAMPVFPQAAGIMRCFLEKWKLALYRAALRCLPAGVKPYENLGLPEAQANAFLRILRAQRCVGASLAVFDRDNPASLLVYGDAARRDGRPMPVRRDTLFRTASIAKLVTAMAVFLLGEAGQIDPDADVSPFLPCALRHPAAPDLPISLRRLLTHTAGIHDGAVYAAACRDARPLPEVLAGDTFAAVPGRFEYSNLGAGIAACVLEGMLGRSFEDIMQQTLFQPLRVSATFYPQKAQGEVADAFRVLPPSRAPLLDNAARRARPLPENAPDPARHYLLSQGNLYISAPGLARVAQELMRPRYAPMRRPAAPFGPRDPSLTEGLGCFILHDPALCPQTLYGHQGLAYGAVHGLFFDPERGRGYALLTSGCSEARRHVLADINKQIIKQVFS